MTHPDKIKPTNQEIERKFLTNNKVLEVLKPLNYTLITQGYLSTVPERTVRVRTKGQKAFLTIKGKNEGVVRSEWEYQIPHQDAIEILALCSKKIVKKRYELSIEEHLWEIDVFDGDNLGLIIAEIELSQANEIVDLPEWIDVEVSDDAKYYNSNLIEKPYLNWNK